MAAASARPGACHRCSGSSRTCWPSSRGRSVIMTPCLSASRLRRDYVTVHNLFMLTQYKPQGRNASEISRDVEAAVRDGRLAPGAALPPVRGLAADLGL